MDDFKSEARGYLAMPRLPVLLHLAHEARMIRANGGTWNVIRWYFRGMSRGLVLAACVMARHAA